MSKEIDFSKAPEGATHYYQESGDDNFTWAKYVGDAIYIFVPLFSGSCLALYADFEFDHPPIKIPAAWSIYTNDKPLYELSDEQVGRLVKHSGAIERMDPMTLEWRESVLPLWSRNDSYRAKQKSERELFVEAAVNTYDGRTGLSELAMSLAAGMIFDSGKFKLVEQPK